jgi:hypothetical protein
MALALFPIWTFSPAGRTYHAQSAALFIDCSRFWLQVCASPVHHPTLLLVCSVPRPCPIIDVGCLYGVTLLVAALTLFIYTRRVSPQRALWLSSSIASPRRLESGLLQKTLPGGHLWLVNRF